MGRAGRGRGAARQTVLLAQLELARVVDELEGAHVDVLEFAGGAGLGPSDAVVAVLVAVIVAMAAVVHTLRSHFCKRGIGGGNFVEGKGKIKRVKIVTYLFVCCNVADEKGTTQRTGGRSKKRRGKKT